MDPTRSSSFDLRPRDGGTGPYCGALVRELGDFRCLLLDRPGWGFSTGIGYAGTTTSALTGDLMAQVHDGLGIGRAHVVGASIGEVWALRLAQRHPSRGLRHTPGE